MTNGIETGIDLVQPTGQEADIFTMLGNFFMNPIVFGLICVVIGIIIMILFYTYIWKRDEGTTFEIEKFEDTVMNDLKKTFGSEGNKSKARIVHGINNPLGKVEKWLHHKGEWQVMEYDNSSKEYKIKTVAIKTKDESTGKEKTQMKELKVPYDLMIFKVKGEGYFEEPKYIIADTKFVDYDGKGNVWQISKTVSLKSFGNAWITSEIGEQYLQDISFRRSLENNMTFLQNQSRKVIFLETAFAQKHELLLGKGIAKRLQYDQYAKDVLIKAGEVGEETDET